MRLDGEVEEITVHWSQNSNGMDPKRRRQESRRKTGRGQLLTEVRAASSDDSNECSQWGHHGETVGAYPAQFSPESIFKVI